MNLRSRRRKFLFLLALLAPWAAAAAEPAAIDLKLIGGRPEGSVRTVKLVRGDVVALRVHSDQAATIHVHGYEIETRVAAGTSATIVITAALVGRFPVTNHAPGARDGKRTHETPLLYIEVHPK